MSKFNVDRNKSSDLMKKYDEYEPRFWIAYN